MPSVTVENYLKQLYLEQQHAPDQLVSMGKLAAAMNVVPGTVTTMVKALSDAGLVLYEPRGGVKLTDGGQQLALHVLRRHRLIELFLVKALGLDWSEVHEEAEELEHAVSDKVLAKIDQALGHPSADPHGDPIPSPRGDVPQVVSSNLANCELNRPMRIARVVDQEPEFLQFVDRCGLMPDVIVRVEQRDTQADAVLIHPQQRPPVTLGTTAAAKILVEPTET